MKLFDFKRDPIAKFWNDFAAMAPSLERAGTMNFLQAERISSLLRSIKPGVVWQ